MYILVNSNGCRALPFFAGNDLSGIKLDLPISSLGDFTVCMDAPFSDYTSQDKLAACSINPNQYVAVGAKQEGSSTLALVAVTRASEAFDKHCDTLLSNGAYWYNCVGRSFGFAPSSSISLQYVDTESSQCEYRLSWYVDLNFGGWRAGCAIGLYDSSYYKQIYILSGSKMCPQYI